MKVLFLINSSVFFNSHFIVLAESLLSQGHSVTISAGDGLKKEEFEAKGFQYIQVNLSRKGRNVFSEITSFYSIYHAIKEVKPDLLHMFTIKPILYGCFVNKLFSKVRAPRTIASITGLGSASLGTTRLAKISWFFIQKIYKFVLSLPTTRVIFENYDDKRVFVDTKIVPEIRTFIVNGAGVNTSIFHPPSLRCNKVMKVVLVARLLKDKGVREFIEAGKFFKRNNIKIQLFLVGSVDDGNISSMSQEDIDSAHRKGYIDYLGQRDDIANIYKNANVACLPSYREGLPKSLIEAAACGLAIVTTDVPGCRQMIFDGENGVLVKPRSASSLIEGLLTLEKKPNTVINMGIKSREIAIRLFDHSVIIDSFLHIYNLAKKDADNA